MDEIRHVAGSIPIIEDTVQGIGGQYGGHPAGALGDLSVISFDSTKMIGGRGGALLFDDGSLNDAILADLRDLSKIAPAHLPGVNSLLPPVAATAYMAQLRNDSTSLLRPFNPSAGGLDRI